MFSFKPTANIECHEAGNSYCGDNGIYLEIRRTNPDNPIRNIRLIMPGMPELSGHSGRLNIGQRAP